VKITFITPHVGRKSEKEYVRTWQMEPLTIATLVGLTPPDVEIEYYDERVERINFDAPTDLAAITVETYTAKRAYEIAAEYSLRRTARGEPPIRRRAGSCTVVRAPLRWDAWTRSDRRSGPRGRRASGTRRESG